MAATTYSVTLHHLAPGAKAAGLAYPDEQLPAVALPQLRELLLALSEVSSQLTIYEPSAPEVRIKTDRDVFIVRTRYRRLCFVGWEAILRGEEHSIGFILTTITGNLEVIKSFTKSERVATAGSRATSSTPVPPAGGLPRWAKIAALTVLILAVNAVTAWMLLRPAPSLLPKHILLSESESRVLLIKAAGQYETGSGVGDRRLIIDDAGKLLLGKYNEQRAITEERTKSVRGAIVDGRAALITGDAVLVLKDADTVVLFGTTYHRHNP